MSRSVLQAGYWGKSKQFRKLGMHRNPGLELVLIAKGRVTWQIDGKRVTAGPGDVTFTFPWQTHGPDEDLIPATELYYFITPLLGKHTGPPSKLRFAKETGLPARVSSQLVRRLLDNQDHPVIRCSEAMRWPLVQLAKYFREEPTYPPAYFDNLVGCVLFELNSLLERSKSHQPATGSESEVIVRAFCETLEKRCDEPWTLNTMAAECGLARTQFASLFRILTGDTPNLGLNRARIRRACELLQDESLTITQVAFAVGFESSQYFSRVFKQVMDQTPSAYRGA